MILGITGGTGSGKTTLLNILRQHGGLVLDCDAIYHDLLQNDRNLLDNIRARFPDAFEEEQLNRKKLGTLVFADPNALQELNRITHSAVREAVCKQLEDFQGLAAIDAIGLFESGLDKLCDLTVAVTAPKDARIARLMVRDGISQEYAASRIAAQHSDDWFRKRCDAVLSNDSDCDSFTTKCIAFLKSNDIIDFG